MQHMPQTVQTAPRFDALPVEHPLPMPEQSLSHQSRGMPTPDTASRLVPLRQLDLRPGVEKEFGRCLGARQQLWNQPAALPQHLLQYLQPD